MPQRTFISKNERCVPGFKAGRNRLSLRFHANAVGYTIRTAPVNEGANPEPWRERTNTSCQSCGYTRRRPEQEQFFWTGSINALSLKSVSTLPVRACLLKLFWYWTMPLAIQNPMSFNTKDAEVVYLAPNTTSLIQPLHQRVIRTFRAHYAQFSKERIVKAIEKNPDRMSLKSGRIIPLRCHHCYKKSHESHESQNNKFVLGNAVSRCCVRLHKIYNRAS